MKKWLKRISIALLGFIGLVIGAGATYQAIESDRAAHEFPPPGKMVEVEGRRLQLDCRGAGKPVVVFESGADTLGSLSWKPVQDAIAAKTRACAYSRPGVMWSDAHESAELAKTFMQDLHSALRTAGEAGPYVMVAHSMGGPYSMIYTRMYPDEVAGLVFVDASHPDQLRRIPKLRPPNALAMMYRAMDALSWTGVTHLLFLGQNMKQLSEAENRAVNAMTAKGFHTALKEIEQVDRTFDEARALHSFGNRPTYVLTSMQAIPAETLKSLGITPEEGQQLQQTWKALHEELAGLSSNSRHLDVPGASHYIHVDKPAVVIDAVLWVVEAVRKEPQFSQ